MGAPLTIRSYGLDEPEIFAEATQLDPQLFAALALAEKAQAQFPITTAEGLTNLLANARTPDSLLGLGGGDGDRIDSIGSYLRSEFFPITDKQDLARKLYISFRAISGEVAKEFEQKVKAGEIDLNSPNNSAPDGATMLPAAVTSVIVPRGTWTKVLSGGGLVIVNNHGYFAPPNVPYSWRRYSGAPPFYTTGDSNTTANAYSAWLIAPYTDYWFYSSVSSFSVTWM